MNRASRAWSAALLLSAAVSAGGPTAWESNTFSDFIKGRFQGISLTRDGRLTVAPSLETLASTGEAGVWSVVSTSDGTLYFASGHRGRVYQLKPGGQPTVVWASAQPEVFALVADAKGVIYAGTSPDGKIYRIEHGKATEYFDPKAKYIWALAIAPDGALYAGTGDQGQVYRITGVNRGEVWYDSGQAHITALAFDGQGRLLAGSEPNGLLYRIEAKERAFVLYDASLPEIRSIVPAPDGSLYVAALGGALAQKQAQAAATAAAAQQTVPMVTSSITVTSDSANAQAGIDLKPKPEAAKPATAAEAAPPAVPIIDMTGVEKAAIYRITPDNMVETLWSSKEENVFDIALRESALVFSTDQRGRIYRLSQDLKSTLLLETREGETTRLLPTSAGLVAATSNLAKLFRLSAGPGPKGNYESAVHDAGNVARWGQVEWRAISASAGQLVFRTRSGNSARPDKTWSDWSAPITDAAKAAVTSPNARYLQWQVEMTPAADSAPLLDAVSISYQPQNGRPVVRSIQVTPQWIANTQKTAAAQPAAPVSYSVTVTDSGDSGTPTSGGTPTQNINRSGTPQLFIAWQADDPENDKLVYSVWYRAEDEYMWKMLKRDLNENTLLQEAEIFADGRYFFRVVASDRPANSANTAKEAELVSQPVLVDQTPPRLTLSAPRRNGDKVEIDVDAVDSSSAIRRAEYSVNGSEWRLLEAADGITDGRVERFTISVTPNPNETSIVVRVFDSAGNPGLARTVVR
jgi:hypothetical protein